MVRPQENDKTSEMPTNPQYGSGCMFMISPFPAKSINIEKKPPLKQFENITLRIAISMGVFWQPSAALLGSTLEENESERVFTIREAKWWVTQIPGGF